MSILRTCIGCGKVFMAEVNRETKKWPHTCGPVCATARKSRPTYDINWDSNPAQKHDERGLPIADDT